MYRVLEWGDTLAIIHISDTLPYPTPRTRYIGPYNEFHYRIQETFTIP